MNWRRNLYILCITNFFANIAFNMTSPFLPEMLRVIGLQENITLWAGTLTSITFLAYAIMTPIWGSLADQHGKRPMLFRSSIGIAISYFLMANVSSVYGLLGARLFNGLLSGYTPASIILVATCTPSYKVGYALGSLNMAVAIGSILGPLVGGVLTEITGVRIAIMMAGILMICVAFISYFGTKEVLCANPQKTLFKHNLEYVLKTPGILIPTLCLLILNIAVYMLQPILPLFITKMKINNAQFMVGLVFSISAVSLAIASPIMNILHHNRKISIGYITILTCSMLMAGIFTATQGLAINISFLVIQRFLFGFFQAGITVSSNVLIAINALEDMRGRVFGIVTSLSSIGFIIGPFFGGIIGEKWSLRATFFSTAVLFFITSIALFFWHRQSPDIVKEA